jgi:hypothetical protein
MKFLINRASWGAVSKDPPCEGALRGPEAAGWPGEFAWTVELKNLDQLVELLRKTGGALGLFSPEEGEEHPVIEIFDEDGLED